MNPRIPHPCNRCEYSRLTDTYADGRWILWCTDGRDEHLGDPDCPYMGDKFLFPEIFGPCEECQYFHLAEDGNLTLVPACTANPVDGYFCQYVKKTS